MRSRRLDGEVISPEGKQNMSIRNGLVVALLSMAAAVRVYASVDPVLAEGLVPNVSYQVGMFDAINTLNGELNLNIPFGPEYKTNGTLKYNFSLHHNANFWQFFNYYAVNNPHDTYTTQGTNAWVYTGQYRNAGYYETIVIDLEAPETTAYAGSEAVPTGNAGPGWYFSMGALSSFPSNDAQVGYAQGGYTSPTGESHGFGPFLHAANGSAGQQPSATVAYSRDNSYLRMRVVDGGTRPYRREIDFPDGTRKHFHCVEPCAGWDAQWLLDWTADPFGNVLTISRSPATHPLAGNWVWTFTEGRVANAESDAERPNPYYDGSEPIEVVREHRMTFEVDPENRPCGGNRICYRDLPMLRTRLTKAELAGPEGSFSLVFDFVYEPTQIYRYPIRPWYGENDLMVPYTHDKKITLRMLKSIKLPGNAGQWRFDYYAGYDQESLPTAAGEVPNVTYTWCRNVTQQGPNCPADKRYPTSMLAGRIKSVKAPTGGGYLYEYDKRMFPKRFCRPGNQFAKGFGGGLMLGVSLRQEIDASGERVKVDGRDVRWRYSGHAYPRRFIDELTWRLRNATSGSPPPNPSNPADYVSTPAPDQYDDGDLNSNGVFDQGVDQPLCRVPKDFIGAVLDPKNLLTLNYYSAEFGNPNYGAPVSPTITDKLVRRNGDQVDRNLSVQTYEVNLGPPGSAGNLFDTELAEAVRKMFRTYMRSDEHSQTTLGAATLKRSTYAKYVFSFLQCWTEDNLTECEHANLRRLSEHTRYHDDPGSVTFTIGSGPTSMMYTESAYVETLRSDFDGLGNFRQTNVYGNFKDVSQSNPSAANWDHRASFTFFNPLIDWSPSQANPVGMPAANEPWILGRYTQTLTLEKLPNPVGSFVTGALATRTHFDTTRGYLRGLRTLAGNRTEEPMPDPTGSVRGLLGTAFPADGPNDLMTITTRSEGEPGQLTTIVREDFYGGDGGGLTPWSVAGNTIAIPQGAPRDYSIRRRYTFGALSGTEHVKCNGVDTLVGSYSAQLLPGSGSPSSAMGATGLTTAYEYDTAGRVKKVTPPGGLVPQTYTYRVRTAPGDSTNELKLERGDGASVAYEFDDLGRLTKESRPMPAGTTPNMASSTYEYTLTGKISGQSVPMGSRKIRFKYDIFDREIQRNGVDNAEVTTYYEGERLRQTTTKGAGETNAKISMQLDTFGRVIEVSDEVLHGNYTYDVQGNLIVVSLNPLGESSNTQIRTFTYDGRGVMTGAKHPELRQPGTGGAQVLVKQTIDSRGHVRTTDYQWEGGGNNNQLAKWSLRYDYDAAERLRAIVHPGGPTAGDMVLKELEFFGNGDAQGSRNQLKKAVRYNYFPRPRSTGDIQTVSVTDQYTYGPCNEVSGQQLGVCGSVTHVATSATDIEAGGSALISGTTRYRYDKWGAVSGVTYPAYSDAPARTITNTYDRGRLVSVFDGAARRATVSYHTNGIPKVVQLSANDARDTVAVDAHGLPRPGELKWRMLWPSTPGGPYAIREEGSGLFHYDGAGNIKQIGSDRYTYDKSLRLKTSSTGGQSESYEYDAWGNLKQLGARGITVDGKSNRMTAIGSRDVVYDDAGNVIQTPDLRRGSGQIRFGYDPLNAMIFTDSLGTDSTAIGRVYIYDAAGERMGVVRYKPAPVKETWSFRDLQGRVLRDFERNGETWTWRKDYVYRGSLLSNTISKNEGGETIVRDIHVDHLGSPRYVSDGAGQLVTSAQGATTSGARFKPYGTLTADRGLDERLAFTGHERDDDGSVNRDADIDYMHARYYAPFAGRFLSIDPARSSARPAVPQTWNRYSYAGNSPMSAIDPDGAEPEVFFFNFGGKGMGRGYPKRFSAYEASSGIPFKAWDVPRSADRGTLYRTLAHSGKAERDDVVIFQAHGSADFNRRGGLYGFHAQIGPPTVVDNFASADTLAGELTNPGLVILAACNSHGMAQSLANGSNSVVLALSDIASIQEAFVGAAHAAIVFAKGGSPEAAAAEMQKYIKSPCDSSGTCTQDRKPARVEVYRPSATGGSDN